MIKYTGITEYYDMEDGVMIDKKNIKDYYKKECKTRQITKNLTRYYGYKYIEIWTERIYYCQKKPQQLNIFDSTNP